MVPTLRLCRANIAEVRADAICTSTNPRLSLSEGTGGAVAERAGWQIKRACEEILEQERARTGSGQLSVGSVRVTTAGQLPSKVLIHCVASDAFHRSSREIIAACVRNALITARDQGCESIAMPVFATGHAGFRFETAAETMAEAISSSGVTMARITIAVLGEDRLEVATRVFGGSIDAARGGISEGRQ